MQAGDIAGLGLGVVAELLGIDGHEDRLGNGVASQDDDSDEFADLIGPAADGFVLMRLLQEDTRGHDCDED